MNAALLRAPWLLAAARVFAAGGYPLYAVGGVVRNALMCLPASDVDLCGPATPEQVQALCEGTPIRAVLRAAHFGTVELHIADAEGRHMAEYTTFRVDSYRCGHQPSAVRFTTSPDVDALRRDFSVNALYCQLQPDPNAPVQVIDPTGGLAHLAAGVLHTVTADPDQVLKDDGLRILRAARFQAELGLTPTRALLVSAANHAPLLADIALERLRDELCKLLLSDLRYPTLARAENPVVAGLVTLRQIHAWPALFGTLPADDAGIAAQAHYLTQHGMPVLAGKLTLLFWQATPDALAACTERLRLNQRETAATRAALTAMQGIRRNRLSLMDAVRLGTPAIAQAAAAFQALAAVGAPSAQWLAQAALLGRQLASGIPLTLKALALHGDDLLPLCRRLDLPEKHIGQTLDALWQATVAGDIPNERAALLSSAEQKLIALHP